MPAVPVIFAIPDQKIKSHRERLSRVIEQRLTPAVWSLRQRGRGLDQMSLSKLHEVQFENFCTLSDEELTRQVTAGCQDALAVLFDRYHRLVFDVALRIVRDPGEAEDIVQNVFLDVFRAMANFDPRKGILKVWILQYAYHRALHRKRHLVSNHFYRWENLETAIEVGSSRALWGEVPEAVRLAEQMLANLKPRQREVVELTYFEGLTAEEIARRLGESPHAVRHHLQRGVAALRATFGNDTQKG
jgi:RNA polymerase sigma-70 factor, ECF subfamily